MLSLRLYVENKREISGKGIMDFSSLKWGY